MSVTRCSRVDGVRGQTCYRQHLLRRWLVYIALSFWNRGSFRYLHLLFSIPFISLWKKTWKYRSDIAKEWTNKKKTKQEGAWEEHELIGVGLYWGKKWKCKRKHCFVQFTKSGLFFFFGGGDPPLARITVYPKVLRGYWIDICGMKAYRVSVS